MDWQNFDFGTVAVAVVALIAALRKFTEAAWAWRKLAKHFRYDRMFVGRTVRGSGFFVGPVNLGPIVASRVSPRGLHLSAVAPLSLLMPNVLMPWESLRVVKYVREPLFRGYRVEVNAPNVAQPFEIRLPDAVVRAARSYVQIPADEQPGGA